MSQRERKKRGRRKYGQAKLKHSRRGINACILAGGALVIMAVLLIFAYYSRGTSAPIIGGLGIMAMFLNCYALYMGIRGFKEREKDYLTCKIGVACSLVFLLCFIIIFCRGLF